MRDPPLPPPTLIAWHRVGLAGGSRVAAVSFLLLLNLTYLKHQKENEQPGQKQLSISVLGAGGKLQPPPPLKATNPKVATGPPPKSQPLSLEQQQPKPQQPLPLALLLAVLGEAVRDGSLSRAQQQFFPGSFLAVAHTCKHKTNDCDHRSGPYTHIRT